VGGARAAAASRGTRRTEGMHTIHTATCENARMQVRAHARALVHTYTRTQTHTQTHTQPLSNTSTHARTCTQRGVYDGIRSKAQRPTRPWPLEPCLNAVPSLHAHTTSHALCVVQAHQPPPPGLVSPAEPLRSGTPWCVCLHVLARACTCVCLLARVVLRARHGARACMCLHVLARACACLRVLCCGHAMVRVLARACAFLHFIVLQAPVLLYWCSQSTLLA